MYFTEGEDREYERMMRERPRPYRAQERDCPYCLYYNPKREKCRLKKCMVYGEEKR